MGSLRQAGDNQPSETPAKGTGGRDLPAKAKEATKGRFGKGARKEERIRRAGGVPGPMDNYVERKAATETHREATKTVFRRENRRNSWDKEGNSREGPEGGKSETEEEK